MGYIPGWAFAYALLTTVLLPIPYYALIPLKVSFFCEVVSRRKWLAHAPGWCASLAT
jgi:hypothetical protein